MNISKSLVGAALAAKGVLNFTVRFAAKAAPTGHIKFQTGCNSTLAISLSDSAKGCVFSPLFRHRVAEAGQEISARTDETTSQSTKLANNASKSLVMFEHVVRVP